MPASDITPRISVPVPCATMPRARIDRRTYVRAPHIRRDCVRRKHSGFTLIELLVVIAIIGLLSTLALVSLNNARKKARDVRRLSDMRQIRLALELYYDSHNKYPGTVASYGEGSTCGGFDSSRLDSDGDGHPFIDPLVDGGFMAAVPTDPLDSPLDPPEILIQCGGYDYYLYPGDAGRYGCDESRGDFFVLGVRNMETSVGPHPASPGWSCPERDWQNEFEWVTGGFTR